MAESQTISAVQEAVVGALGVSEDEAAPDATLMDDLGAESIDLLDILFRIERSTGVKIQASDLSEYIQGGIPDDEFSDENEIISEKGLEQLKKVMPQIDADEQRGNLHAENVIKLFTVQNLADMVEQRGGSAGS
ncbi:MAG: acyl carrier protein [Actinobacteria bacterium]|nr:MAG: acyl carrier protein [Actinomycetota bacterium]TML21132.1 MAG: acyl carrier protein [Actinomycetota bacterium]